MLPAGFVGPAALRLEAAEGLALVLEASGWRVAWGEPDWLGPVGLALDRGGKGFAGPDAREDREPLRPILEETRGEDALGAFRKLELAWDGSPLPLRASLRAYQERALLVFRLEAAAPLDGISSGEPRAAGRWAISRLR